MRDNVGQVLQRRVSSNGKDAGDRLCVPTRRMQRQDALAITSALAEIRSRLHQRRNTKKLRLSVAMFTVLAVGILTGCSETSSKSPDVSDSIRKSLDQAGFKDVTVGQDRDKGVVTLGGQVARDNGQPGRRREISQGIRLAPYRK